MAKIKVRKRDERANDGDCGSREHEERRRECNNGVMEKKFENELLQLIRGFHKILKFRL